MDFYQAIIKKQRQLNTFCNQQTIQKLQKQQWFSSKELELPYLQPSQIIKINTHFVDDRNSGQQQTSLVNNNNERLSKHKAPFQNLNDESDMNSSILNTSFQRKLNSKIKTSQIESARDNTSQHNISRYHAKTLTIVLTVSLCYISKKRPAIQQKLLGQVRILQEHQDLNNEKLIQLNTYDCEMFLKLNDKRTQLNKLQELQRNNQNLTKVNGQLLLEIDYYKKQLELSSSKHNQYKEYSEQEFSKIKELQNKIDQILELNKKREEKLLAQINKNESLVREVNNLKQKEKCLQQILIKEKFTINHSLMKKGSFI